MKMELGLKTLLLSLSLCLGSFAKTLKVDTVTPSVTDGDFTIQRNGTGGVVLGDYSGVLKASTGTVSAGTVDLASEVNGILGIANGGTGSSTQNFVDLSTDQTVGGSKTFSLPIVLDEQSSTPSTPPSGFKKFYAKDDGKLYSLDSTGSEVEVGAGAGSGGINYITNFGIETNADGYTAYADAAATEPVDGTGGTPNVTVARNTTTPLRGDGDLLFTKDAADRQGEGFSYDFTIDVADQAKKLTISLDYSTSANYADDDMGFYIYDVTNASVIRVNGELIKAGDGTHYAQFQTAPDSTSYRLIGHVRTTNANLYTVSLDNIKVGPTNLAFGPYQNYEEVDATGSGSFTGGTLGVSRVGNQVTISVVSDITHASSSSVTSAVGLIPEWARPVSRTRNTYIGGGAAVARDITIQSTGRVDFNYDTAQTSSTDQATVSYYIQDSSTQRVSEDLGGREIVAKATISSHTVTGSLAKVPFDTEEEDTTSSMSSGTFTVPETGRYFVTTQLYSDTAATADNQFLSARIYVSGTEIAEKNQRSYSGQNNNTVNINRVLTLNKDDTVEIRSTTSIAGGSASLSAASDRTFLDIIKLASPQTMLETETVAARYTSDSGQAIGTGLTTLVYEDISEDTHAAYDTSTGEYTVPISGNYKLTAIAGSDFTPSADSNALNMSVFIDGSESWRRQLKTGSTATTTYPLHVSGSIYLSKGQVVTIRAATTVASSMTTNSIFNAFSIERVK